MRFYYMCEIMTYKVNIKCIYESSKGLRSDNYPYLAVMYFHDKFYVVAKIILTSKFKLCIKPIYQYLHKWFVPVFPILYSPRYLLKYCFIFWIFMTVSACTAYNFRHAIFDLLTYTVTCALWIRWKRRGINVIYHYYCHSNVELLKLSIKAVYHCKILLLAMV